MTSPLPWLGLEKSKLMGKLVVLRLVPMTSKKLVVTLWARTMVSKDDLEKVKLEILFSLGAEWKARSVPIW